MEHLRFASFGRFELADTNCLAVPISPAASCASGMFTHAELRRDNREKPTPLIAKSFAYDTGQTEVSVRQILCSCLCFDGNDKSDLAVFFVHVGGNDLDVCYGLPKLPRDDLLQVRQRVFVEIHVGPPEGCTETSPWDITSWFAVSSTT